MSKNSYLGENEVRRAVAHIRKQVEEAPSFDEALPCTADASYIHEKYGPIRATVKMEAYVSKHRPQPCYLIEIDVKLPNCNVSNILTINPPDQIEQWFDDVERSENGVAFLRDIYRLEEEREGPRLL
ncbi:hypothetical protein IV454_25195 [Massilia antarctica]|uniref:Uncharacterized protein n=1 Tax=Massilia antarctica TaxID=2765360 RepID=A0AA48WA95_9BURK|nr:hypothetical protein [Massilia antarctica]QPI48773.1 hypothetical protein IV454_25195 [Massilia antarctica]